MTSQVAVPRSDDELASGRVEAAVSRYRRFSQLIAIVAVAGGACGAFAGLGLLTTPLVAVLFGWTQAGSA